MKNLDLVWRTIGEVVVLVILGKILSVLVPVPGIIIGYIAFILIIVRIWRLMRDEVLEVGVWARSLLQDMISVVAFVFTRILFGAIFNVPLSDSWNAWKSLGGAFNGVNTPWSSQTSLALMLDTLLIGCILVYLAGWTKITIGKKVSMALIYTGVTLVIFWAIFSRLLPGSAKQAPKLMEKTDKVITGVMSGNGSMPEAGEDTCSPTLNQLGYDQKPVFKDDAGGFKMVIISGGRAWLGGKDLCHLGTELIDHGNYKLYSGIAYWYKVSEEPILKFVDLD